jgi:hypothetical protein
MSPTQWGANGDTPVPADYTGDRVADIATYRTSGSAWFVKGLSPRGWGNTIYINLPMGANYTGDSRAEFAIFRPYDGVWQVMGLPDTRWGLFGDVPV